MTESITISRSFPKSEVKQGRWQIYLVLGLLANAAIWGSALLYLKNKAPTYTSTWAVSVPGAGSNSNVSLPNIGGATYENSSPYSIGTQDPRQNYKFIAESEPVITAAAAELKMSPGEFGPFRTKLPDSTTFIQFEVKGASPEEARSKSFALYKALQTRLNDLRAQEIVQRDGGFQSALSSSQNKLTVAQRRLSEYKARSGLSSSDQLKALSDNIEQLRRQKAETLGQYQQASARLQQLSANLNSSGQQATDAFVLQSDQIFQQNLKDYSETSAALDTLSSKFLPDHPTVIAQKAKRDAAEKAMLSRGQFLLGRPVNEATLQKLNLSSTGNSSSRETLFQNLITVKAEAQGLESQAQEIDKQVGSLERRLKMLAQQETTLEALNRDLQVAEAVFSSTLARLDIGRSNAFGSYPLIQMIAEPTLSQTPTSPKKQFILLGTSLGSLFITMGLVTLWLRTRKISIPEQEQRRFKSEST